MLLLDCSTNYCQQLTTMSNYNDRRGGYQGGRGGGDGGRNDLNQARGQGGRAGDNINENGRGVQESRGGYQGGRGGGNFYRGRNDFNQARGGDNGNRGGFQGGRGGQHVSHTDNLTNRLSHMNIGERGGYRGGRGGCGGSNMYSNRPNQSRVPRVLLDGQQPGDLAGSAQYPNAPIAKKNLAHTKQAFAERPDGWVHDNKAVGTKTELLCNHALVHLPEETLKLWTYNIDVYKNRKLITKREEASPIFHDLIARFRRDFPNSHTFIYNDVNMLWTTMQLPRAEGRVGDNRVYLQYKYANRQDFGMEIRPDQDRQTLATLINAISTARVRSPACDKFIVFKRNMFMLQGEAARGAEVFDFPVTVPLRHGLDARLGVSTGIHMDLRVGITACFDIAHTMFSRPGYPLIRLLCELINNGVIEDEEFENIWDERLQRAVVTNENHNRLDQILKKTKLRYSQAIAIRIDRDGRETVPSIFESPREGRDFKYYQLTPTSAAQTHFVDHENRRWTVAEYFLRVANIRLRYPNLPCLVKKPSRQNNIFVCYPMEFVSFVMDPRRFEGHIGEDVKNDLIQYTTYTAPQRLALLQNIVGQLGIGDVPPVVDNNDRHMTRHGLSIDKELLSVKATVLPAPTVVYGEGSKFEDVEHLGEWEAVTNEPIRKVLEDSIYVRDLDEEAPKRTKRLLGSILHVKSPINGGAAMQYDPAGYHRIMKAVEESGQPVAWENKEAGQAAIQGILDFCQGVDQEISILEFFAKLKNNLDENKYKKCDEEVIIPFVLVIFEVRCSTLTTFRQEYHNDYNYIKYLGDNEIGIFTQGILVNNLSIIQSDPKACKLTRLMVEKILGKIGTTHRKLEREGSHKSWTKLTDPKSPTLVLGVDVSHPSPREREEFNVRRLSVASVVGNIDFDCKEFRASSRIQDAGEEKLVRFQEEIAARLNDFIQNTGSRPAHIVVYRDGLCETDFQRILYEERLNIEQCCVELAPGYQPTITYIVVTKRHHTRFFLKGSTKGHETQGFNVLPGTLVEDTVTTKDYYDFYLTTQVGQKGVAKPTHYYILHDTWKPKVTFWPTVTHALTYMFCRATSTVSLPAPVLYAHLAAKRAKECLNGVCLISQFRGVRLSVENVHDVAELTRAVNVNNGLDGMTFV
ncbi:hypothetical protein CAEBREN_05615 [Caenorhabditis brenneri]|uniref:Uncharacterized protein n=1 Tax=Caenorhabditis brenneri TaxID=135651 RepID=G0NN89_CAEBE|nr:hypothetical protein CAEBREN_05615 [Caenorhabditis brenneri]